MGAVLDVLAVGFIQGLERFGAGRLIGHTGGGGARVLHGSGLGACLRHSARLKKLKVGLGAPLRRPHSSRSRHSSDPDRSKLLKDACSSMDGNTEC